MHTITLALGSNVGNREKNILSAIKMLGEKITDITCAPFYQSKAVGYVEQNDFINTALVGKTNLAPEELLAFTQHTEKSVGRIFRFHWGPREIDIDIIFFDNLAMQSKSLQIPHPRMHERDFVLKPLADIAPDFLHPKLGRTVRELYTSLDSSNISIY